MQELYFVDVGQWREALILEHFSEETREVVVE
jgi:hypothetical protein